MGDKKVPDANHVRPLTEAEKVERFGPAMDEHSPLYRVLEKLEVAEERLEAKKKMMIDVEIVWERLKASDNSVREGNANPMLAMITAQIELMPAMIQYVSDSINLFKDDNVEEAMDAFNKSVGAKSMSEQREEEAAQEAERFTMGPASNGQLN